MAQATPSLPTSLLIRGVSGYTNFTELKPGLHWTKTSITSSAWRFLYLRPLDGHHSGDVSSYARLALDLEDRVNNTLAFNMQRVRYLLVEWRAAEVRQLSRHQYQQHLQLDDRNHQPGAHSCCCFAPLVIAAAYTRRLVAHAPPASCRRRHDIELQTVISARARPLTDKTSCKYSSFV